MSVTEGEQSLAPKDVPNAELLARLEKLENLIAAQNREGMLHKPAMMTYSDPAPVQQPSAVAPPMSPQLQKLTDDALWLERSYTGQPMLVCVTLVLYWICKFQPYRRVAIVCSTDYINIPCRCNRSLYVTQSHFVPALYAASSNRAGLYYRMTLQHHHLVLVR